MQHPEGRGHDPHSAKSVDEYNKLNPEYPILFTAAWATSSEEELYHVRDLVRRAQKKMSLIAEEGGSALAGMERGEA